MLKLSMTAAIAVTLSAPVAIALPADHTSKSSGSAFHHVQYRDGHRDHRYAPGAHMRQPPRGWHRYHARPRDWRDRGCVIVGPVWFCP